MFINADTTKAVLNAVRYEVKTAKVWDTFVIENEITRDMIADTARELASLAFPKEEPVQSIRVNGTKVRTVYGNAVQAAAKNLRSALDRIEGKANKKTEDPDWVRLVRQAVENARRKGEVPADDIMAAVKEALQS